MELELAISVLKDWVAKKWARTLADAGHRRHDLERTIADQVDLLLRALFDDCFVSVMIDPVRA